MIKKELGQKDCYEMLMENLPCGAGIYEYHGGQIKCIYLNERYWQLVARQEEGTDKTSVLDFVQLEDRAHLLHVLQKGIMNNQRLECDIHILHGSGKYIPFHLIGNIVRQDSKNCTIYVTYTPISESEITFREMIPVALDAVMASSSDIAFVKDRTLSYVCVSHTFATMVGYLDERDIIGKSDYDLFDKALAEKFRGDDQGMIRSSKSMIDCIEHLPSEDGSMRFMSVSKYLLRDQTGMIVGIYGVARDITQAREAYRRLRLLTDNIPGGLATYEIYEGRVKTIYMNEGVYTLIGYTKEEYDTTIGDPLSFVLEEDIPKLRSVFQDHLLNRDPIDTVFAIKRKQGDFRYINLKCTLADYSEASIRVDAVLLDVTEVQIAQNRLRMLEHENRRRYEHELQLRKELIRNSILYYQLNLSTGIIEEYYSKYDDVEGMKTQIAVDPVMVKNILRNIAPDDRNRVNTMVFRKKLLEAYQNGRTSLQFKYRRKIGNSGYHWVSTRISILEKPDSGDAIAFLHSQDIDIEMKKQLTVETIMDDDIESVIILNKKSGDAYVVHVRNNLEGLDENESFCFDERYYNLLSFQVVQEDQERFRNFFCRKGLVNALREEKNCNFFYSVYEKGKIRRKMSRVYYLDNHKSEIVLARRDITDLYEEEQKQKEILQMATDKANAANRAKSAFLSQMSHDIRTPLNAILAFSNKEMMEGAGEEELKKNLEKVNLSGDYLLGIINDVLDMSKIEQNKVVLKPVPYSHAEFVKSIQNVIMELSKNKNIDFVMDVKHAIQKGILVDKIRFNQIFINLLSNAVKFTPDGGRIEFIMKKLPGKQNHVVRQRFIIRDTGIGMSPEFLPHAFESFNQEYHEGISEKSQGTGLGLAIVKELVSLMEGTVQVRSTLGKGTTFTVELPLELVDTEELHGKEEKKDYGILKGCRILLGEDNELNTEIVVHLLTRVGCDVICSKNGKEAVEAYLKEQDGYFSLILMDIRMPIMNGLDAALEIRHSDHADAATIPIIAMTADVFSEDEEIARKSGMNDRISKPFAPKVLYEKCIHHIFNRDS